MMVKKKNQNRLVPNQRKEIKHKREINKVLHQQIYLQMLVNYLMNVKKLFQNRPI